jgi:hypothetical protein
LTSVSPLGAFIIIIITWHAQLKATVLQWVHSLQSLTAQCLPNGMTTFTDSQGKRSLH